MGCEAFKHGVPVTAHTVSPGTEVTVCMFIIDKHCMLAQNKNTSRIHFGALERRLKKCIMGHIRLTRPLRSKLGELIVDLNYYYIDFYCLQYEWQLD